MSQALTGTIAVRLATILTDALDNSVPNDPVDFAHSWSIATGTGASQADRMWHDTRTLTASSSEDLDLVGALTDAFGDTFSPARIKMLLFYASSANTNTVIIGNAAATQHLAGFGAATHTWAIQPGDIFLATARGATAWPCAAASTDDLKVLNGGAGTSVTYTVFIVASSA